jgi:hypothetical protein
MPVADAGGSAELVLSPEGAPVGEGGEEVVLSGPGGRSPVPMLVYPSKVQEREQSKKMTPIFTVKPEPAGVKQRGRIIPAVSSSSAVGASPIVRKTNPGGGSLPLLLTIVQQHLYVRSGESVPCRPDADAKKE